jgi:hypothetical protein
VLVTDWRGTRSGRAQLGRGRATYRRLMSRGIPETAAVPEVPDPPNARCATRHRRWGQERSERRSQLCSHPRGPSTPGLRAARAGRGHLVPNVWRSSWKVRSGAPARARAVRKRLRSFEASRTCPVAGVASTRSNPVALVERPRAHPRLQCDDGRAPVGRSADARRRPRRSALRSRGLRTCRSVVAAGDLTLSSSNGCVGSRSRRNSMGEKGCAPGRTELLALRQSPRAFVSSHG